ncbi:MAG: 3D domain-containing protein [Wujia sp.]
MKISFEQIKESFAKYRKQASMVVAVTAICSVCTVVFAGKIAESKTSSGVMITLSDVKAGSPAFAGEKLEVSKVSYEELQNYLYETDLLAELETSEKQIDDILSSKRQDKKDQAALDALTATVHVDAPVATTTTSNYVAPAAVYTYADENGTYESVGEFVITAYCPCPICCGAYSNMTNPTTASGTRATAGRTIAADTSKFPFGTQLVINGQVYTVEDRGGAIYGNRIDIYFNTHQEAINFGRRTAMVYKQVQ